MVEILKDLRFVEQLLHRLVRIGNLQSYDLGIPSPSCRGLARESKIPGANAAGDAGGEGGQPTVPTQLE